MPPSNKTARQTPIVTGLLLVADVVKAMPMNLYHTTLDLLCLMTPSISGWFDKKEIAVSVFKVTLLIKGTSYTLTVWKREEIENTLQSAGKDMNLTFKQPLFGKHSMAQSRLFYRLI